MGPRPVWLACFWEEEKAIWKQTHRENARWQWGQMGLMGLQARERLRPMAMTRGSEEERKDSTQSLRGSRGLLTPWLQVGSLQNGERIDFCAVKPGLWHFVIEDPGNWRSQNFLRKQSLWQRSQNDDPSGNYHICSIPPWAFFCCT